MKTVVIIPARLESTRLPRKVLADIAGKPMVQWVYERAQKARRVTTVYIASDSDDVELACQAFFANVIRTNPKHRSGTDRVAEAARELDAEVILNVQADEPLLEPKLLDQLAVAVEAPGVRMASAMAPLARTEDFVDPNVVKVVCDLDANALYFSRAPIPWPRGGSPRSGVPLPTGLAVYQHIGIYAYRREALFDFAALPPVPLEYVEKLEQLRALAHGWKIKMVMASHSSSGVDTEKDLARVRAILEHDTRLSL